MEIVDLPINNIVIFQFAMLVYQRVTNLVFFFLRPIFLATISPMGIKPEPHEKGR